jgi:hypothetical protein
MMATFSDIPDAGVTSNRRPLGTGVVEKRVGSGHDDI